jgi:hypothetical protein
VGDAFRCIAASSSRVNTPALLKWTSSSSSGEHPLITQLRVREHSYAVLHIEILFIS